MKVKHEQCLDADSLSQIQPVICQSSSQKALPCMCKNLVKRIRVASHKVDCQKRFYIIIKSTYIIPFCLSCYITNGHDLLPCFLHMHYLFSFSPSPRITGCFTALSLPLLSLSQYCLVFHWLPPLSAPMNVISLSIAETGVDYPPLTRDPFYWMCHSQCKHDDV